MGKVRAYDSPIGIPAPFFGIDQVHTDYAGSTYVAGGFIYRDAGNGPYSHYIDNTSGSCTDTANTYGTETIPRCIIPTSIPTGSVVELHGGPYSALDLSGGILGTAQAPIFIRGYDRNNKTVLTGRGISFNNTVIIENASYLILENLICDGSGLDGATGSSAFSIKSPSDHISIRYSEMRNYPMPDFCPLLDRACWYSAVNGSGTSSATYEADPLARSSYIVWYNNYIHDNSIYPLAYETGRHGIMVESGSENIWILDNKIERSGDDGVQVFHYAGGEHGPSARNIYIGRNEVNDMGENAFDIKQSYDVVMSENKIWGFRKTDQLGAGSDGSAIVLNNDDPSDRLWVINNEIFDSNLGIRSNSIGNVYLTGNIIRDIVRYPRAPDPTALNTSGCGIAGSRSAELNIAHNTFNAIDAGICLGYTAGPIYVENNLISDLNEEIIGYAIAYYSGLLTAYNNLINSTNGNNRLFKVVCSNCLIGQNPLFTDVNNNNFHLLAGSPAIGAGTTTSNIFEDFETLYGFSIAYDYDGNPRPAGAWTLGAFEYVSDPTSPSSPTGLSVL